MDTISVEQAMASDEWPKWEQAMQEEIKKLSDINTWEFVRELPPGRKPLLYKWVLKKKYDIYNKLIYCQSKLGEKKWIERERLIEW